MCYTGILNDVGSKMKLTAEDLDVPLGMERMGAIKLLGNRWALWLLLAINELDGARFSDLIGVPGLSRRVLAEQLKALEHADLIMARQYQARPPRQRYLLTDRGQQARRVALMLVHIAAGGRIALDPLTEAVPSAFVPVSGIKTELQEDTEQEQHPVDKLLVGDLAAAERIYAETVEVLVIYDDRYSTSLIETLEIWLQCDTSVSVTAARMYTHRHTIRYRLDRVRDLTKLDPSVTQDRERLMLGLRARRVLARALPVR